MCIILPYLVPGCALDTSAPAMEKDDERMENERMEKDESGYSGTEGGC